MEKIIPRSITWFNGDEWDIRPIMTVKEFQRSPASKEYRMYKTYVSHSIFLNEFMDQPENSDLLNTEEIIP